MQNSKIIVAGAAGIIVGVAAVAGYGMATGWVSPAAANKMAEQRASSAVVSALTPICVAQAKSDPDQEAKLGRLKASGWYGRAEMVMQDGWATMPGAAQPNAAVAEACVDKLGI